MVAATKPNQETKALLERVDKALLRMSKQGDGMGSIHYCRLLAKRKAVAAGMPYRLTNVSEELIGKAGGKLAHISKATCLLNRKRKPGVTHEQ